MAILVTGGAGYIGSVMVDQLAEAGEEVVVIDNVSRGHHAALAEGARFYEGRVGDLALVERVCRERAVEACIHFAALAYVGESVTEPKLYFENNVAEGLGLLDGLRAAGVRSFVFSSTCATYGEPVRVPIDEGHPQWPVNPYGWSKFFMERILESYDRAYGLRFVALRYFNAAGATLKRGEHHEPETHLIPNVLAAAAGRLPHVSVFGSGYPTPDGTCVRDYIHVTDLCSAHTLALAYLRCGGRSEFVNLGNGHGYSVMEVIEAARRVTGREIEVRVEAARPGDPARLVADARKAREVLGWKTQYPELDTIVRTAWEWHEAHPEGYGSRGGAGTG
ncbi:MAG: UDP-glucose 4-epimerase GalE [Acidobacteria bacterium]|nr:UDP-glucose 4-epimerase GalE [Acidobacteriota bacterium]MCA1620654.1 UDP-glucose 4-epimerase GalE [Acidobacteriota bacterium]